MLALAMAFLAKPDVLMIDELSLGLAPLVVEQLLAVVRQFREQGVTVILVEQSVNVALTTADKAFFMEKGEVRFHGLTSELLERPDLLRSIFLEGAAAAEGGETQAVVAKDEPLAAIANRAPEPVHANGGERRVVLETRDVTRRFSGITAVDGVSLQLHEGEIVGIDRPRTARARRRCSTSSRGSCSPDAGAVDPRRRRRHPASTPTSRPARARHARSRTPGCSPRSPCTEAICVALDRPIQVWRPGHRRRSTSRTSCSPSAGVGKRVDELIELMGLDDYRDKFVSELSTGSRRIVDLACQIGPIEPKVILLDEPSSGIAQRETEALGPLLLRIRDITGCEHPAHRARHAARELGVGSHHRLRPRPGRGGRRLGARAEPSPRGRVVSGVDVRGHRTFGAEHRHVADRSGRGGTSMTQADTQSSTETPQFKAADEQVRYEDLNWFRRILRKYTNSFSVAGRHCSGRCFAVRSAR